MHGNVSGGGEIKGDLSTYMFRSCDRFSFAYLDLPSFFLPMLESFPSGYKHIAFPLRKKTRLMVMGKVSFLGGM